MEINPSERKPSHNQLISVVMRKKANTAVGNLISK
jgi:hypothetical protein